MDIESLEPKLLWRYFLELSRIPRTSKHEARAARWVLDQGRALGLEAEQDEAGNVLIRKGPTPGRQDRPTLAIQAHVDMVGVKTPDSPHDFAKDPIEPYLDGDLVKARGGTTLGADNGIGVASALAVLASDDLAHGPLEVLVTVDEETGMTGAKSLRRGWLRATYLLNVDSEEEGFVTIGCAGGVNSAAQRAISTSPAPIGHKALRIKVFGGRGGHSGIDIAAGRANAIRLLAQVLFAARGHIRLAAISGGTVNNAIPAEASAVVTTAKEDAVRALVAEQEAHWRAAFGQFDPNIKIAVEEAELLPVMSDADAEAVIGLLLVGPTGVEAMSPDVPGLPQTSTNLGVVRTEGGVVRANFLSRSSIDASKAALCDRIAAACALTGFKVDLTDSYPGWKPEPEAHLLQILKQTHRELFGEEPKVIAIHAGLECGMIGEKHKGLQMASIGPNMWDVHTPKERVSVSSVARFWRFLRAVIERV